eukprot:COSAG03_NODE_1702_length_3626_cov_11.214630_2_plen_220_part_00
MCVWRTTRRGRGRQVPRNVQSDRANRPVRPSRAGRPLQLSAPLSASLPVCLPLSLLLCQLTLQLRATKAGGKVRLRRLLRPRFPRHALRTVGAEEDVWRFVQHVPCDTDRLLRRPQARDSAAATVTTHDRGVHLVPTQGMKRRTTARVKQRAVLHSLDRQLDGIQRTAALAQALPSRGDCSAQHGHTLRRLNLVLGAPSATVNDDCPRHAESVVYTGIT